jgi:two-component system, cell cycle sensor histidine kinase and response regulator CckA
LPGPDTPSRVRRLFVYSALALLILHAALLLAVPSFHVVPLFSNLIQLACPILAALSCISASRRLEKFGKHFWLLVSAGFFVWALAQTIATYYDSILHVPTQQPWPSDIVFFLSLSLPLMTLFMDRKEGFEWKQWPRVFDLAQVLILMLAVFLFTFQTPDAWRNGWGAIGRLAWIPETSRDILLLATFALSGAFSKDRLARSLYSRMAIFFFVYLCGEFPYLFLQATHDLRTGSPWDLVWSVPFLVATAIAALPPPPPALSADTRATSRDENRRSPRWAFAHVASLVFPLVVLMMAAGIAEKQLLIAVILVILSFSCSVARIVFAEYRQLRDAVKLQESNALLQSVFEGTGDALFIKDLEGRYILVNKNFADMLELPVQEVIGKFGTELVDANAARMFFDQDRAVVVSGAAKSFEYEMPIKNKRCTLLTNKAPHRDGQGNIVGVIGVVRDITEYRQMEEQLRQSQKMEAIGTLAGGVAHDFNNLLTIINGYSSVLFDALSADHQLRPHADQIFKAGERAAALTRQLLAFSRKQTIQAGKLNLNQIIGGMEKLLKRLIGENILISTQLAPDLGFVLADAGQVEQVIINLAVNARDAMPNGGRLNFQTRNVEMDDPILSANNLKPGRYVEFLVSDTGVGMDLEVQTRLFEPFFTTKAVGKGTGLGLSTVYGILNQSKGHISFTSQPGKGSTFRVYLPRTESAQLATPNSAEVQTTLAGTETVLLVEDDTSVCDFIRAVLSSYGYNVLSPKRPQDAEALFEAQGGRIDLLLSDVIMPEISGAELAKRLAAKNPGLRVLFMSGYIGDDIVRQGIQEHDVPFLQKPFTPISLAHRVRETLDGSRITGS